MLGNVSNRKVTMTFAQLHYFYHRILEIQKILRPPCSKVGGTCHPHKLGPWLQCCINTAPVSYAGQVAPEPLSIMTKLCYCNTTRYSDIVTEQERSLAISTNLVLLTLARY